MMHLRPDLVRPLGEAGPGKVRSATVKGFRERWAWTPRHWVSITDDTGVGNPQHATAEKGAAFLAAVTTRVGDFLVELSGTDAGGLYGEK